MASLTQSASASASVVPGGSRLTSSASLAGPAVPASMMSGTATPARPARKVR